MSIIFIVAQLHKLSLFGPFACFIYLCEILYPTTDMVMSVAHPYNIKHSLFVPKSMLTTCTVCADMCGSRSARETKYCTVGCLSRKETHFRELQLSKADRVNQMTSDTTVLIAPAYQLSRRTQLHVDDICNPPVRCRPPLRAGSGVGFKRHA